MFFNTLLNSRSFNWDKCKDLNRNKILGKSDYFLKVGVMKILNLMQRVKKSILTYFNIKAKTALKNTRAIKNAVCKNSRTREYPGFTVQTEQVDFQAELHITAKTEYF